MLVSLRKVVTWSEENYKHLKSQRSKHHAGFFEKSRYMVGGKLQTFKKPAHIEFYNQNMGSVDAVDQDLEPYGSLRKSYTWFTKVNLQLMLQMLLNSKVLYSKAHGLEISMYDYIKLCSWTRDLHV
ncbi:Transposase IS4 [Popillia japonica]|uniref:Transposase IS4 n=1 Tax=Popillia japonica TaxID=7064 RepID=A0AAW1JD79_POPJA